MGGQMKVRGNDLGLGEVERILAEHPAVGEVSVLLRANEGHETELVAYVVPAPGEQTVTAELRRFATGSLPARMVPSAFVLLNGLPLDDDGNLDRDALPSPEAARPELETTFVAPRDPVELQLREIWEGVLGRQPIGVTDDYQALGGHSLLAVRLFAEIEERFGRKLSLDVLTRTPTIEYLAAAIRQKGRSATSSCLVPIRPNGSKPPLFAVPPSASPAYAFARLADHLGPEQPLYGLKPPPPDGRRPPTQWFEKTAALYVDEMRTVQPKGPYYLLGRYFGAFVAFEMAQQLLRDDQDVGLLVLMDVGPPITRSLGFHLRGIATGARFTLHNARRYLRGRFPIEYALIPNRPVRFDLVYAHKRATATYDKLVWDASLRAAAEYVMRPYPGRITVIQSEAFDPGGGYEVAWSKVAARGTDYHSLPGDRDGPLHGPAAQTLAKVLEQCIPSPP